MATRAGRTVCVVLVVAAVALSASAAFGSGWPGSTLSVSPSTAQRVTATPRGTLNTRYQVVRQFWTEWEFIDCTQPPGCTIGLVDPTTTYLGPTTPIEFAP